MTNKHDAEPVVPAPTPVPTPEPAEPELVHPLLKYDWSTIESSRHTVRVICDEEGLPVKQKNDLCGTVGAESGWQSYYLKGPKLGQPVIRENFKNGKVWSTDFGVAQINDYYHIGAGKDFPSSQYVLDNPEACIRWMCKQWKAGHQDWWVAHKNKSYLNYL